MDTETDLPNVPSNILSPLIASTTPLPDVVFINADSDTMLLFPPPDSSASSGFHISSEENFDVDYGQIQTSSFEGSDFIIIPENRNTRRKMLNTKDKEEQFDDYDYYDFSLTDSFEENYSEFIPLRGSLRQKKIPSRWNHDRSQSSPNRGRELKRGRLRTVSRPRNMLGQIRSTKNVDSRWNKNNRRRKKPSSRLRNNRQRGAQRELRNRNNKNPTRHSSRNRQIFENYDVDFHDYSIEEPTRFTEHDVEDYSDEKLVEQWYFDYYDYDLENKRNANQSTFDETTLISTSFTEKAIEPTTEVPIEMLSEPGMTFQEMLAEVFRQEDLLRVLQTKNMTNLAALITFFANQDLFTMLKTGQTHRQTFNMLVRQLLRNRTKIESIEEMDSIMTNDTTISSIIDASLEYSDEDESIETLNDITTPPPTASNSNSKGEIPNQSISRPRPTNSRGKKIQTEPSQPFKVFNPFQLLESSGLLKSNVSISEIEKVLQGRNTNVRKQNPPKDENLDRFLLRFGENSKVVLCSFK